jgi:hypothetical protein
MSLRSTLLLGCVLLVGVAAATAASKPDGSNARSAAGDDWRFDVTVVAIAPDGTWGVATKPDAGSAIAGAIDECRRKYMRKIGCGYRSVVVRRGWTLLFRCGTENVLAAGRRLAEVEQRALRQERILRARYVPELPPCVRTLTVDPDSRILAGEASGL